MSDLCPHGKAALKHIKVDLDIIDYALAYGAAYCSSPSGQSYMKRAIAALERIRTATNNPQSEEPQ